MVKPEGFFRLDWFVRSMGVLFFVVTLQLFYFRLCFDCLSLLTPRGGLFDPDAFLSEDEVICQSISLFDGFTQYLSWIECASFESF